MITLGTATVPHGHSPKQCPHCQNKPKINLVHCLRYITASPGWWPNIPQHLQPSETMAGPCWPLSKLPHPALPMILCCPQGSSMQQCLFFFFLISCGFFYLTPSWADTRQKWKNCHISLQMEIELIPEKGEGEEKEAIQSVWHCSITKLTFHLLSASVGLGSLQS